MSFEPSNSGSGSQRMSRPELFMSIARLFGERSSCPRAKVGAVAIRDGRIVATGYVGAPSGQPHCTEVGCDMKAGHCVRSVHAEANLIAWAARTGTSLHGSELWCTHSPCMTCAKLIVNAGFKDVIYEEGYGGVQALLLLESLGCVCTLYADELLSTQ